MFAIDTPQSIKQAYQDIKNGDDPWVAIGDFSHDWYGNYPETAQRIALVSEPVEIPGEAEPVDLRQWAAFCAASVEYLCQQAAIPVPSWVYNPHLPSQKRKHSIHPRSHTSQEYARDYNKKPPNHSKSGMCFAISVYMQTNMSAA